MSQKKFASGLLVLSALTLSPSSAVAEKIATKKASSFPPTVKNPQPGEIIVKCAGIVKKGANHCASIGALPKNSHGCSNQSANYDGVKDFDKHEWIYVRKEVCEATPGKIVGKKRVVKG